MTDFTIETAGTMSGTIETVFVTLLIAIPIIVFARDFYIERKRFGAPFKNND
jgi:hypothetical protein